MKGFARALGLSASTCSNCARLLAAAALVATLATPLAGAPASAVNAAAAPAYPVLTVRETGGFAPPWVNMQRTPTVAVYSDGSILVTTEVTTMVYPGPAAPRILRKSGASLPAVLAAADAAHVTDPAFDWGSPLVTDLPDTEILTQRSPRGPVAKVSIYALGITGPNLSKQQLTARRSAAALISKLRAFDNTLVPTKSLPTSWVSSRWVYRAAVADKDPLGVSRLWFGAKPLDDRVACAAMTNAENRTLVSLLPKLNQASRFTSSKKTWQLTLRPLFPHESGCAAVLGN